ncbi:MAG: alkaline phosphatase family protein [Actinomycetaceae bacterium]|nr:alkaline phosphatase family protein [Actinomycetaceae bacterium]
MPLPGELHLTEVLGGAIASLSPDLPGALPDIATRLGLDQGEQCLVILVDGLGLLPLEDHYGHAPTLRALRSSTFPAHTVAPSTTAAGITAFATGARPGATRMVGYSVAYNGAQVASLLTFEHGVDPRSWQEVPPLFERLAAEGVECAVISPAAFANSGLTRAALSGARHVAAQEWTERCEAALKELRNGTRVVYLYWSEVDHAGHGHGIASDEWVGALEEFDRGLAGLIRRLPATTRAVLTADHGMVDVNPDLHIDLAHHPFLAEGVRVIAGETRAVHVHAFSGQADNVRQRWEEELADRAWITSAAELSQMIGPGPGSAEMGDFVAWMKGRHGIVNSMTQHPGLRGLIGVHGSLTAEEMLIPVVRLH